MKRNLLNTLSLTVLLGGILGPSASEAQCLCDGGIAPFALKYSYTLDTTSMPSSVISFPKFDPTQGVLNCVSFFDTLSLVTSSHVVNNAPVSVTYKFLLNVTNDFSGPGVSVNESASRVYGPTLLSDSGTAGSQTVYGPDTLFRNSVHSTSSNSVVSYLAPSGNVDFTYTVNGGLIGQMGGIKYAYEIKSKYWGKFGLTYFWCPNAVLSTNIKDFAAVKSNKNINLSWIVGNNLTSNTYEIQVSKNGREFYAAGNTEASSSASGASAKYTYQYNPNQVVTGKLYFRIRQTDANGKVSYSAVRVVNMDSQGGSAFTAYPNPAVNKVSLQFDGNLNGEYKVDVTNQVGQVVISRPLKLRNTSLVDVNLERISAPGMYYVRLKDAATGQLYTSRIMINR